MIFLRAYCRFLPSPPRLRRFPDFAPSFMPMRSMTRLVAALILSMPVALSAQAQGILPRTTQLPASTRAMALGDAYMMNSGHADAIFYHPALLTQARGFGLDVHRWGSEGSATAMSGAVQWLGGGVGVGLRTLQYGGFGSGVAAAPAGQDDLFQFGSVAVSERVATVGYAHGVPFDIDVGVSVDFVDERVGTMRQNVVLFDLGLAREVGPVTVGVTVHDLGDKPVLDTGTGPSRVVIGAGSYGRQLGILDIGYAATVGFDDDDVTFGGGVEVGYWPVRGRTFVARLGLQDSPDGSDASPVTMGFAFWGDDITVEWAFRPISDVDEGGTHRFGIRWR